MKMVNKLCVSDCVYTLFKKTFLLLNTALLKCFVYSKVGILDYPWCNNPCHAYQELDQGDFYSFDQKFIYYLPTKNVTARKTMLTSISSTTFVRVDIYRLVKIDLLVLLLFLVNYPPSTTTLRFPHSSSMNISLGKSIKFPIPSISIPSCSSSTVLTLFEGFPLQ